ncbi:acyltransferase family protein [Pararhizobium antarcticum]|uniref:Acyltransferase 3 domain-containing protein n=1 Tax=Pararhizobium antarcticum TaxID=1798805 RepID=A0A657LXN2_9HYPH|nr:acyltransferase [Pararhizobium antarcticum]OJF92518.1 hypothetical protein AX761_21185 [Rhizobium sp. 58]OJG00795.1 hypothetical protein AX760_10025 [Pararhizobium antarcticum]
MPFRRAQLSAPASIASVQYLRVVACWCVVLFHIFASLNSELGWSNHFGFGAIGVDIFFVISGYIMAMIIARDEDFRPMTFLMKRIARIVPIYWVMSAGAVAITFALPHLMNRPEMEWSKIISSMLFLPDPVAGSILPIISVGWTLNLEMFFYCLVAFTVWISGDRGMMVTIGVLVLIVLAGLLVDGGTIFNFFTQPLLLEFAFGILIWRYGVIATRQKWFTGFWLVSMPVLVIGLIVSGAYDDTWRFAIWGLPAAFFFLGAQSLMTKSIPWLQKLGDWSFSTYLLHVYVIQLFVKLIAEQLPYEPMLITSAIGVLILVIAIGSAAMFHLFEKPVTMWLNSGIARWALRPRESRQPL